MLEGGASMKLPACSCEESRASTWRRSSPSLPQACSRNAARPSLSRSSAPLKIQPICCNRSEVILEPASARYAQTETVCKRGQASRAAGGGFERRSRTQRTSADSLPKAREMSSPDGGHFRALTEQGRNKERPS